MCKTKNETQMYRTDSVGEGEEINGKKKRREINECLVYLLMFLRCQ